MAIIQQIQQKTGCLFLAILGSLLLFVISDLIRSDTSFLGGSKINVGEISGQKISYEEFNTRYNNMLAQVMENNPNITLDEAMKSQYEEQAWNSFLQDKIFAVEYEKVGIQVSGEELADMTIGDNPDQQVVTAFTGQNGQFDKNRLIKFLQEDIEADEQAKARWLQFEDGLKQNTLGRKYAAVVRGAIYVTKLEAKNVFKENNHSVTGSFVGVQYSTIPDEDIKITDEELKKELNENKEKYRQEASRDIEYVSFSILPTSEDTAATVKWANEGYEKFKDYPYDSIYVNIMSSENPWDGTYKRIGSFDKSVDETLFTLDSGQMLGPIYENGKYSIYKISDTRPDSQIVFKASHILISLNGATREDSMNAQNRVNTILGDIRSNKITFENATVSNPDGSGGEQGNLGYVTKGDGRITENFYNTAAGMPVGQIFVVTDEQGIHIAKVTSQKYNKLIKVAILSQSISAGRNTVKTASDKANEFLAAARMEKNFGKAAESLGLTKRVAFDIRENDISIPGITEPKQMVRWLYDEKTNESTISEIMSFTTSYIIAKCTKVKLEGIPEMEDVRSDLELVVRNRKKGDQISKKFEAALKKSKNMDQLAKAVGSVEMLIPGQLFANDNVPGAGYDLKVLGALFGTGKNKFSPIIRGENAVYVIWVTNVNTPQEPEGFEDQKRMLTDQNRQAIDAGVLDALRKKANIKDQRYKYF